MFAMLILPAVSCDRQWKAAQTELNYLASLRFLRPLYWLFFVALRVIISSDQELSNLSVSAAMQQQQLSCGDDAKLLFFSNKSKPNLLSICSRSKAFIPDATSQIEGLTVITSKEWIEERNSIPENSSALLGTLHHKRTSTIRRNSCPSPVSTRSVSMTRWWRVRRFTLLCPWRWDITRSYGISTSSISLKVISSLDRSANRATCQLQWIPSYSS